MEKCAKLLAISLLQHNCESDIMASFLESASTSCSHDYSSAQRRTHAFHVDDSILLCGRSSLCEIDLRELFILQFVMRKTVYAYCLFSQIPFFLSNVWYFLP
mmetsp:Transcript_60938/g.143743  ORF Transcript_60938/g.143743 Transcript_60938/m.143743 type:complete len:102 (+) Transcript_60938:346-651(+)